jgi:hypothetical protein
MDDSAATGLGRFSVPGASRPGMRLAVRDESPPVRPGEEIPLNATAIIPPSSASPAEPRALRTYTFFLVVALVSWWEAAYRQGGDLGVGRHLNLAFAASLMVVSRVLASAVEALAYTLWWRARGARLPYVSFLVALVALSIVDRCALSLAMVATRSPALGPWLAPVAGLHLLGSGWLAGEPGLRAALGSFGLLTLARITLTAWLQAAALQRRLGSVLLVTAGAWLVTRVVLWWMTDLLRGMSPIR